ncbi:MAG: 3-phosphoserine/phosphohydroxythreonine transaminase [Planctomycetes bacterium]|nr:3-phosphoserine/phosphohydroxythreonine transaminase [Planctomycetota bacterium]
MTERVFNFSAGPAMLPEPVLEEARENLLSLGDTGIGILEHSHRGPAFKKVYEDAVAHCRQLADIPEDYHILFLHGGASMQFCMLPMNFLTPDATADYLITGRWSQRAIEQAQRFGQTHVVCSSKDRNFCYIPKERQYSERPTYVHFTSNNTIYGTQFTTEPDVPEGAFLACDASSDIFSRPIDITKYGLIYAGAQKNLGPSGIALAIIRDDLVQRGAENLPDMLQYRTHAKHNSAYNTPSTFGIYVMGLVFKWLLDQGGLAAMEERNRAKANKLYEYLDQSSLFQPTADADSRSMMNITFVTGNDELDAKFCSEAAEQGLAGLKGHRSVGGMRASIYNAFPERGVDALIDFMRDFEAKNG